MFGTVYLINVFMIGAPVVVDNINCDSTNASNPYKTDYLNISDELYYYYDPNLNITGVLGVDVSAHQSIIEWDKLRNAGVQFAIIRCGYRGYISGTIEEDSFFQENLANAKSAGISCGVYFYSQAVDTDEAIEEAEFVLSLLNDSELEHPIAYDWERPTDPDARTMDVSIEDIALIAQCFCNRIRESGYCTMLYAYMKHLALRINSWLFAGVMPAFVIERL